MYQKFLRKKNNSKNMSHFWWFFFNFLQIFLLRSVICNRIQSIMSILVKNRYEVAYRPIPITDTDKHLPYRQNRYIGKKPISAPITDTYRYRLVHYVEQNKIYPKISEFPAKTFFLYWKSPQRKPTILQPFEWVQRQLS